MPQSLTKLYAHLIFSTKHRQPLLDEEIRARVHGYLATGVAPGYGVKWPSANVRLRRASVPTITLSRAPTTRITVEK